MLGKEGVVFKLNFEKTYDYVDWGFFGPCTRRKRFTLHCVFMADNAYLWV